MKKSVSGHSGWCTCNRCVVNLNMIKTVLFVTDCFLFGASNMRIDIAKRSHFFFTLTLCVIR